MLSKHANLQQYKKGNKDQITSTVEHSYCYAHIHTHTHNNERHKKSTSIIDKCNYRINLMDSLEIQ